MNEKQARRKYYLALSASFLLGFKRGNRLSDEYVKKYYNDPPQWIADFVDIDLPAYDVDILTMIKNGEKKIAVFGPHGLGKSVIAALIVLWAGSVSADCKIITTASAWRQLEEYLWPEIHKWHARTNWAAVEAAGGCKAPRMLTLECHFGDQSKAFAVASDNPVTIEGAHAQRIVYIFDESKAIPSGTWESADGAFATPGDHLQLALSTPGDTSGEFYSICSRQHGREGWKVRHVSLREAIRAGRISLPWAREKRKAWGRDSLAYQNRVWGLFAKDSPDSIIPLSWVMAAVARWHARYDNDMPAPEGPRVIGADTAGHGVDSTVFYKRIGKTLALKKKYGKSQPMELAGILKNLMGNDAILNIDTTFGEGVGTAYRLEEQGLYDRINKVQFSERTDDTDRTGDIQFANVRAQLWWNMREMLDPENKEDVELMDDEALIGDLVSVKRAKTRSDGRLQIEPKDDIKKRIGRSPDEGDACCLAFYKDTAGEGPGIAVV